MTSFLSPTGNLSTGVQVLENNGTMSSVSPTQPLQYVGNDGLGQITAATLVAGTGIQIEQVGNTAVFSASTAPIALWNSILTAFISFNFTLPLTQSISSQTQSIPYDPTAVQNFETFTAISLLSVLTAKYLLTISTNVVATDTLTGNNTPVIIALATYMTDGTAPTTGQLPIDVSFTYITATSTTSTISNQSVQVNTAIKLQPTTSTFGLYVVPYIYTDAGSTLSGTVIETNATSGNVGYVYESNQYAVTTPLSPPNQLQIYKAPFTLQTLDNTAIPKQSSGKILLSTGAVTVSASPALTMISFSLPSYFSNLINGGQTFLLSYFIEVNGVQIYTDNIGNGDAPNFLYQQMIIDTPLLDIADGSTVDVYISYSTYTGGALTAYFPTYGLTSGSYFTSYYSVFAQDAATAIGSLALPNEGQTVIPIPNDVILPTSAIIANYEPPNGIPSPFPTTSEYVIDTVNVNLANGQNLYRVEFTATIYTDAYSSISGDTPCIAVYVYQTTGSGASLTPLSGVAISYSSVQNYVSGNFVAIDVMCEGYINLFSSSQLTAYACLFCDTINVSSTTFKVVGTSSTTIPYSSSFWTLSVQSIGTSSGGGGNTTITVDAGSYLTSSTTTSGYDLGTQQANPTQAGLVATADLIPANDLIQMGTTGAVGCTITSADSSVTVVTTQGNIDLSTVGVATTVTANTGSFLVATDVAGDYELDTQQASPLQDGLLSTVDIIPANDLLQMGAAGTVGCTLTSTNGSVTVTTTEGNIDLATVAAASSGTIGIYSPLNQSVFTLSADLPITTVYVSATPTLAQMQTIASQSITAKYSNSNGVGSNLQVGVVTGAYTTNTSAFGMQLCLFSSADGFTAPIAYSYIQQGACSTNTRENYVNFSIEDFIPSQQGVSLTFSVGAAVQSGLSVTIDASSFTFIVQEDVADTQSLVASTPLDIGTGDITISSGQYKQVATINVTKQYVNSYFILQGYINAIGSTANGYIFLNILVGTNIQNYYTFGSGNPGTSINAGGGINTIVPIYQFLYPPITGTAAYPNGVYRFDIAIQAQYFSYTSSAYISTPGFVVNADTSVLYVNEVLPIADGGAVQTQAILPVTVNNTPYVTTLSPQYSTMTPVTSLLTVSRAGGSNLIFTFSVQNHSTSTSTGVAVQNAEGEIIVGFYSSNASTATPYTVRRITNPSGGSTNPITATFRVVLQSPAPETPISLYVAVGSLTSTFTNQSVTVSGTFVETYNGSTSTQGTITTVDVAANSYLQSSTSGSTVTLNTTQSSPSQAGLVATSASVPANSLIQMGATGAQGCTLASSDSTVIITPSSGSINLSSGLTLSAGTGAATQVRNNTLNVASVYPNVAWTADYLSAGISSGSTKPIYDSTAQYVPAYTASSSQLNLSEYTRFTATSASPPSANNTANPQWIAVIQPSSSTVFQARTIELLVQPYLLGATSVQGQAFALNAYYRMVLGVNITGTATPISFSAMTPLPLSIDSYGVSGVPTVADTPPWLTFAVLPASSSPSSQFTTGNVLVVYAQWILSQTAGITVGFNLAFRTLF